MTQPGFPVWNQYGPNPNSVRGYPSIPPTSGPSIPPNSHRPNAQKSQLPYILGGVGGFLLLAVVLGGVAFMKLRSKSVALPVDAKMLPAQTTEVGTQLIEATRETDERVRRAYLAAELGSELCRPGASDPARRIEAIGTSTPRAAKELFLQKRSLDDMRQLLQCGAYLGGSLDSPYQAVIGVDAETPLKPMHRIAVGHFKISDLPPDQGFSRHAYKGVPGFCRTGIDSGSTFTGLGAGALELTPTTTSSTNGACSELSYGAFAEGTTWFMGRRPALEIMAETVKRPKEDLNTRIAALKEAANQTEGMPVVRIQAQPKSSKEFFMAPCSFGALHSAAPIQDFLEGCFPKANDRLLEEIDSKLKAAAYETDGDVQKAKAFHGNIVFVARDDAAAKDVERDVKEIVSDWSAHVELNEAKLIRQSNQRAVTTRQKKFAAIADSYFKALREAKVARKGRTVRISFKEALSKTDITALEDADRATVEKRQATASILDAIERGAPLPQNALAQLVGPSWAAYLASATPVDGPLTASSMKSPLPESTCRSVQSRLAGYTLSNFTSVESRSLFLNMKYASCASSPPQVDSMQHLCLVSFKTASEFASCTPSASVVDRSPPGQPPDSDFGDRAMR